ncbi:MAG: hypothetical protein WD317_06655 [Balneolaceae bacterium]
MNREILDKAFEHLEVHTGITCEWGYSDAVPPGIDGKIRLTLENLDQLEHFAEVRKEIRKHHIPQLRVTAETNAPL